MRCGGESNSAGDAYGRQKSTPPLWLLRRAMLPSTRRAIRCTGMEVPDTPGPRIGRRVIKNGYMGALGQVRLATRLITSPIDGLRGRAIYAASIRKLRLLHGPILAPASSSGLFCHRLSQHIHGGRKGNAVRDEAQVSMPTRHGGSFRRNARTQRRFNSLRTTTRLQLSTIVGVAFRSARSPDP
jgi:hypothetical protein